jgi:hypothetical protein
MNCDTTFVSMKEFRVNLLSLNSDKNEHNKALNSGKIAPKF